MQPNIMIKQDLKRDKNMEIKYRFRLIFFKK